SEQAAAIRNKGEARAAAIISAANARAATIHGEGEAKLVAIYAAASGDEPQFFDFYRQLQAERRQLLTNTKLLVISVDSPWFRALGPADKKGGG
ncbi:MAG TPA: protease modulator HflC, partial [Gammaproteobacteria bacterium]|nr:protease modulator HflC [Gammaproteobacteria bacterium]